MRNLHESVALRLKTLSPEASGKSLHKVRVRKKKLRYVHDMIANSDGAKSKKISECCRHAQADLGKLHDFQNIIKAYEGTANRQHSVVKILKYKKGKHKSEAVSYLKKLLRPLKD